MSALLRRVLATASVFFLCSCAVDTKPNTLASVPSRPDDTAHLAEVFAQQGECYAAWSQLVNNWETNGGGFKDSLRSTKKQISIDQSSVFAVIVRDVWSAQAKERSTYKQFGQWPVSSGDIAAVIIEPNDAISNTLDEYLPHGCGAFTWLYPVIWDKTHVAVNDNIQKRHFEEMPKNIVWDSYNTPRWILYWLLVRNK